MEFSINKKIRLLPNRPWTTLSVCGNTYPFSRGKVVLLLQTTTHTSSSAPREGLLGVLCLSQASNVPRGSGDGSEVVESSGVPSYQTMGTLRMQVGPCLCGLEQLLKPRGAAGAAHEQRGKRLSLCRLRGEGHNKPRHGMATCAPPLPRRFQSKGMFER